MTEEVDYLARDKWFKTIEGLCEKLYSIAWELNLQASPLKDSRARDIELIANEITITASSKRLGDTLYLMELGQEINELKQVQKEIMSNVVNMIPGKLNDPPEVRQIQEDSICMTCLNCAMSKMVHVEGEPIMATCYRNWPKVVRTGATGNYEECVFYADSTFRD